MSRAVLPVAIFALLLSLPGCRDTSGVVPVSGKITVDGKPLTSSTVTVLFKPDAGKGNTSSLEAAGSVDDKGAYSLLSNGKSGAAPGWYRVVVSGFEGKPAHSRENQGHRPSVRSLLPAKYGTAKTTDLMIEVVQNPAPGAYDLKLTSQ